MEDGFAVIPRITSNQKCGQGKTGIVQWNAGKEKKFHLYCFNSSGIVSMTTTFSVLAYIRLVFINLHEKIIKVSNFL